MLRLRLLVWVVVLLCAWEARGADAPSSLTLSELPSPERLTALLWERSPDLAEARGRLGGARADVRRSLLLPNPTADLSWNTIPVGKTNPTSLEDPLTHVPNYAASLSWLVEIGKRGPRQRAARSGLAAAELTTYELLRQRYFDLLDHVAEVAAAELRVAALSDLAGDAARLKDIQRERAKRGDVAALEVDRAQLEEEKYVANLGDEKQKLSAALLECSRIAGVPCEGFESRDRAAAFLARRHAPTEPGEDFDQRPDLRSLGAQEESARASIELARNRRIPDPTFRAGYVYDQFVASGDQRNSVFVGVSVPLPVFDHGQADAIEAAANADAASRSHALLRMQAVRDASRLAAQAADVEKRRALLHDKSLPLARTVVDTLSTVVQRGGAPLQDLLMARRTLGELLLDGAELDLQAFQLSTSSARNGPAGPPIPPDLRAALRMADVRTETETQ